MANPAIEFTTGNVTTDGTEQVLFDVTADKYFSAFLFTDAQQNGDTIVIRIYIKDLVSGTMKKYMDEIVPDLQTSPAHYLHFVPAREYKVTIQKTAGTNRTYNWYRASV